MKPYLRDFVPNAFEDIPDATAYEAGYLVTKNAGWRNVRPVIDAQSRRCDLPRGKQCGNRLRFLQGLRYLPQNL